MTDEAPKPLEDQIHAIIRKGFNPIDWAKHHKPHLPDPPHVPNPGDIAKEVKDAVDHATRPLQKEIEALRDQVDKLTKPANELLHDAQTVQKYLDDLASGLGALKAVQTAGQSAAKKAEKFVGDLSAEASTMATRLGGYAYDAVVDVQKFESHALDSDALAAVEKLAKEIGSLSPQPILDALKSSVGGDGKGYRDQLRPKLEAMATAAQAVPGAMLPCSLPANTLDLIEAALDVLPDAATDALASIVPHEDLDLITNALRASSAKSATSASGEADLSREDLMKTLIIAGATLTGITTCLKVVKKGFPFRIKVATREATGAKEKGGVGLAAAARGEGALGLTESIALTTGIDSVSPTEIIVGGLVLILDSVADILNFTLKRM